MYEDLKQKLSEQRQRVWSEYRTSLERPASEWTAEDRQKLDRMDSDLAELDKRLDTLSKESEREIVAAAAREGAERHIRPENGAETSTTDKFLEFAKTPGRRSMDIDLRGIAGPAAGFEERVVSVANDPNVITTTFSPLLYRYLIQNSAIRQTNVRVITTDGGENYEYPKFTGYPAEATVVGEGATIGTSDPTFGRATLGAYKFGWLWQVSNELLQDSAYDILSELAFVFGRALANGEGKKFLLGTGTSEPEGLLTAAGSTYQVVGGTPAANGPTYTNLVDTMHEVIPPYRVNSSWLFSDKTLQALRKLVDGNNRPLWQPGLAGFGTDVPDTILGKPYRIDPYMPDPAVGATSIAYGDFSAFMIRDVAGVRLERSDDFAFNQDLVSFRILHRADSALIDTTGAIATYKGGTA